MQKSTIDQFVFYLVAAANYAAESYKPKTYSPIGSFLQGDEAWLGLAYLVSPSPLYGGQSGPYGNNSQPPAEPSYISASTSYLGKALYGCIEDKLEYSRPA